MSIRTQKKRRSLARPVEDLKQRFTGLALRAQEKMDALEVALYEERLRREQAEKKLERVINVRKGSNVVDIVGVWLDGAGYDGLVSDGGGCACDVADLAPCGGGFEFCRPGHKVTFAEGENCGCGEGCDYHICTREEEGDNE